MLPMRVEGPPRMRYTRLGFSPQAIFRPERAPGNFISCTVRAGMSLRIALRPPIKFAEPGSAWIVVIPPAIASGICGSCGQNECSAHTSAVTGFVASLPSDSASVAGAAYTPRWECVSIRPGVTYLPVPSTTAAPAGASTLAPTATMRPSLNRTDPLRISWPAAVMSVALRISTGALGWRWYVDGYCARNTLVLSALAPGAAGVAVETGRAVCRAPDVAQAHVSASSTGNSCRMRGPSGLRYFTSSTTNGCPTNSVFRTRRGVSVLTYIVNGTRAPVTSTRNARNEPAATVTL